MISILKLAIFVVPLLVAYGFYSVVLSDHPVPIVHDEYWGPESKSHLKDDERIKPFEIKASNATLEDLKIRLKLELNSGRYKEFLEGAGFQYGFNSKFIKTVATYWLEKYDWETRQRYLNKYPHYKTKIGGLDIHFQHVKPPKSSKYKKTLPLILIHGWPGSFVEYQRIIPFLIGPEDSDVNFELVIPSIPGYGFSEPAARPGLYNIPIAHMFTKLMHRLGYKEYYSLGEDWGTLIATDMALLDSNVKGSHVGCYSIHPRDALINFILSYTYPSMSAPTERLRQRNIPFTNLVSSTIRESGYLHIQATKPDTVGMGLSQSPSGLAAYILEKFSTWTNERGIDQEDGYLLSRFTMDQLLDNVMVYWITNSITSSMRLYKENFSRWGSFRIPVRTPVGCISAPEDPVYANKWTGRSKFPNMIHHIDLEKGGHFTSYELPQVVAKSAVEFFNAVEKSKSLNNINA